MPYHFFIISYSQRIFYVTPPCTPGTPGTPAQSEFSPLIGQLDYNDVTQPATHLTAVPASNEISARLSPPVTLSFVSPV